MRNDFKWIIYLIALGITLTAYAHNNFATKGEMSRIRDNFKEDIIEIKTMLKTVDGRVFILLQNQKEAQR